MKRRCLALLLAACFGAVPALAQTPARAGDAPQPRLPAQELTPQILYQFLLAEIAGTRGNVALAVDAFRELVRTTRDPRIAKRAAEVALYARRYDAALDIARVWIEIEPGSTQAKQMLTSLLAVGGRPEELAEHLARQLAAEGANVAAALMQINRVLARHADKRQVLGIVEQVTAPYLGLAEAHYARALAAHFAQDAVRALGEAERALALRPDWERAALLRFQLLPRADALESLRRFVAEQPGAREARRTLARELVGEKRYAEARREFVALLETAPDDADTLYAVAVLSYQLGESDDAARHFRRLVELGSADANSARLYLGQIDEDAKRWEEALKWYREITPGEQYLSAQLHVASILNQQGRLDQALRHLQGLRSGHPEDAARLTMGEAQLLRDAGRPADALAVLDEGLAASPDQPDLLYESALAAEKVGRLDLFESRLLRLIEIRPDHAHAYNALGFSYADRNERLDEAQRLIEKALALEPDDHYILDSKGWILFRRGDLAGAHEVLRKAYAKRADGEIAAHLGEVLWALGRREEALKLWHEALRASPSNEVLAATIKRFKP